jgi:Tfp pilus assembly protein PilV
MSFIELLVSLVLLSIIMLCTDGAEVAAMRQTKAVFYAATAKRQINNLSSRLVVTNGEGELEQIKLWNEENAAVLPQGKGIVSGVYPDYDITLSWGGEQQCDHTHIQPRGCLRTSIQL